MVARALAARADPREQVTRHQSPRQARETSGPRRDLLRAGASTRVESACVEQGSDLGNATPTATVRRLTSILDCFLEAEGDLGITEIAGRLGLAKSVVHRLVTALADAGYLAHSPTSRRYALGPKAVRLGLVALGRMSIRERAQPILAALAAETGETVTLSLLDGDQRVYAEQVESAQVVRQSIQLGLRAPLYIGASGKAMLAFLPAERRDAIVRRAVRSAASRADGRPVAEGKLLEELERVRERGFAISQSERVLGAASAAAPVFDHHANVVGCISVASVTVRHDADDLPNPWARVRFVHPEGDTFNLESTDWGIWSVSVKSPAAMRLNCLPRWGGRGPQIPATTRRGP